MEGTVASFPWEGLGEDEDRETPEEDRGREEETSDDERGHAVIHEPCIPDATGEDRPSALRAVGRK